MKASALAAILCGCAPAATPSAAPVVHARADAPHPGPCETHEDGPNGSLRTRYEYDPRDRLVRELDSTGGQRLWSYDEDGQRVRQLVIEGDRLHAIWYVYDDRGLLVATEEDATGKRDIVLRREREYDDNGRLVRLATTRNGETVEEHALHYDDHGKLAWELVARGSISERIDIGLDPAGRIVERRSPSESQRFVYAMTGRLEGMLVERDGRLHRRHDYAYDDGGNLVRASSEDAAGRPLRTTRHSYACWSGP